MLLLMSNYHVDAFLKNHNIYNICLSKTLLGSTVPINDENITIDWYSLLEAKHPNDPKRRCWHVFQGVSATNQKNRFNAFMTEAVDWFLYDNGLRHERVNYYEGMLSNLCQ